MLFSPCKPECVSVTFCRRKLADSLMGTRLVLALLVALVVTSVAVLYPVSSSAATGKQPPWPCVAVPSLMSDCTLFCCLQGEAGLPPGSCYLQQPAGSLRTAVMRRECLGHSEAWPCAGGCTFAGGGTSSLCRLLQATYRLCAAGAHCSPPDGWACGELWAHA